MCQYYRWQCTHCLASNDVVVRCRSNLQQNQLGDPCARTSTLPLPADAPKLECQDCQYHQPAINRLTPSAASIDQISRQNHIQPQAGISAPPPRTGTAVGSQYPAENDVFWVNPAARLPNPDSKLRNYNQERAKVFDNADKERITPIETEDDGGSKSTGCQTWEASWTKLKDALKKG